MPRPTIALLCTLALAACTTVPEPPRVELRDDGPGEAAAHWAMKRGGTNDLYGAYERAREVMREMPRYDTSRDALVERRQVAATATTSTAPFEKWTFLGPGNVGGRTRALVIDPRDPNVVYAGGVSGGIWRSNSGGAVWTPVGDELANIAVNSLVMHPTDSNVLYAGTGEGFFREEQRGTGLPLRGAGIFVTRDAGVSWTRLPSTAGEDFQWVNDLVISTHDPLRVYAATRTGVHRSTDGGTTWARVLATTVKGGCLDLAYRGDTAGDYLFAACGTFEQAHVYRNPSAEGSGEWTSVLTNPLMGRTSLAIAPSNPSIIYALSASNQNGIYQQGLLAVYRSNQNGDAGSWSARVSNESSDYVETLLLTNPYVANVHACDDRAQNQYVTMGWYCNTIAVDPRDPEKVWVGGVDLFRSDDGGATWGPASFWWTNANVPSFVHADQHLIVFHPQYDGGANQVMFFANDGGVYKTANARAEVPVGPLSTCDPAQSKVVFSAMNRNYGVTQFYHGAVYPDGRRFVGGTQDNGTIVGELDRENEWRRILGGDGAYVAIDPVDENTIYAESQNAAIRKSVDGGRMFTSIAAQLGTDQFLFVTPFLIDPNNHLRLWIGGGRMWRTDNAGSIWRQASTPVPGKVSAIAVAPGNANRVVAGTHEGFIVRNDSATTATSATVWATTRPRAGFVSSMTFDPVDGNVVYTTYSGFGGGAHVWKSIDGGATWSALAGEGSGALPDIPVHSIVVDPTRRDRLYLGTDLGVFVSLDGGQRWAVENTGFTNVVTEALVIAPGSRGPAVYAFTHGRGVWRAELVKPGAKRRSARP